MRYFTVEPPNDLKRFVRCFWVFEGEASKVQPYIYRGYADGCCELVFHYQSSFDLLLPNGGRTEAFSAGVHAQTNKFMRCIVDDNFAMFGCYIYPFALPLIFGYAADELSNEMIDLDLVLTGGDKSLKDQMLNARNNDQRVEIMTAFLRSRLNVRETTSLVERAFMKIYLDGGGTDIELIAKRSNLSRRSFERKFKEIAGFSPRHYSRIVRFQKSLRFYDSGLRMTDIAQNCGYFDQAHFISDFKRFSGYSPKAFFSGLAEGSEYLDA